MVDQIERGEVRALIVFGGNPLSSFPDPTRLAAAFASLDVLAVLDVVATETVEAATHAFGCTDPLERADVPYFLDQFLAEVGSRYTPAVVAPAAGHRHAWQIFHELGRRLGIDVLPDDVDPETVDEDELLARLAARAAPTVRRAARRASRGRGDLDFGWVEASLPDGRWRVAPPTSSPSWSSCRSPTPTTVCC